MALPVTNATPRTLSGVKPINPGTISGVQVANPGFLSGVGIARPGTVSATPSVINTVRQPDNFYQDNARTQSEIQSLLASLRPVAPAPIDIAAINAQARKQAEESVNPFYTKKLNDMLARQAVRRQRAQQDYEAGLQTLDESLKQTTESNALERGRVTEDTATNMGQLNTIEDQYQTATGQQFEDERLAEAERLAASGLTTSGIGRQQAQRTIDERNVKEGQDTAEIQAQRTAQAILKARTFEDLAKSDVLAASKTKKGKKAIKLDLDRLIEDISTEEQGARFDIESQRLNDISGRTGDYSQLAFNNYLAGIRDPRVFEATARAYGGIF